MRQWIMRAVILMLCAFLLTGCSQTPSAVQSKLCEVTIEEGTGFRTQRSSVTVRSGEDAVFLLIPEPGYTFGSVDYADYTVLSSGGKQTLTLCGIRDSAAVRVTFLPCARKLRYHGNGGLTGKGEESVTLSVSDGKLRGNTSQGTHLVHWEGYTLYAWNTQPDGSGVQIGEGAVIEDAILLPGSRIGKNCRIKKAIINEGVHILPDSVIEDPDGQILVIGANSKFAG